jgi:hypothetical protein
MGGKKGAVPNRLLGNSEKRRYDLTQTAVLTLQYSDCTIYFFWEPKNHYYTKNKTFLTGIQKSLISGCICYLFSQSIMELFISIKHKKGVIISY